MKRETLFCLFLTLIGMIIWQTGCTKVVYGLSEGTYAQQVGVEQKMQPKITFDLTASRFLFAFDPLSNDTAVGTIMLKGKIIATTDNGKHKYIFEVVDNDTIRFVQSGSSKVTTAEGATIISDGTEFKFVEKGPPVTNSTSISDTAKNATAFKFTEVNAEPGSKTTDIAGANFDSRKTMAFDGSRLYWITPDYGITIVSSNINGQDRVVLYPGSYGYDFNVMGGFKLLTVNGRSLLFVSEGVGLFRIPIDGGTAKKLIAGNIQDYMIKDNMIYYSDFKSDLTADDGFYALKSYNTDTQNITEIDQLSTGKELLKVGGYIVGFQNGELIYTRRDDKNRRSYYSYAQDGKIKSIPYGKGQQIETEMAKKGLRPLDQESSEVRHVEGKSLVMAYNNPGPNSLYLAENNNKKKIADVKGDYVYLFNGQIFVLDRESNVEHVIFR